MINTTTSVSGATSFNHFLDQLRQSNIKVSQEIGGREVTQLSGADQELPDWAKKHIQIFHQLKVILTQTTEPLEEETKLLLDEGDRNYRLIANKVCYETFLKYLNGLAFPNLDKYHLLTSTEHCSQAESQTALSPLQDDRYEWHINQALLRSLWQRSTDPELTKLLYSLVIHYLAKISPCVGALKGAPDEIEAYRRSNCHHGFIDPIYSYFRQSCSLKEFAREIILEDLVNLEDDSHLHIMSDDEYSHLFPIFYEVLDFSREDIKRQLDDIQERHNRQNSHLNRPPRILIDLTAELHGLITCSEENRDSKMQLQNKQLDKIRKRIETALQKQNQPEYDDYFPEPYDYNAITTESFLCVCRFMVRGVPVLTRIPLFDKQPADLGYYFQPNNSQPAASLENSLFYFVTETGASIDPLALGNWICDQLSLDDLIDRKFMLSKTKRTVHAVDYAPLPGSIALQQDPFEGDITRFTKTALFQRLSDRLNINGSLADSELYKEVPHVAIMGRATLKIIAGLIAAIAKSPWGRSIAGERDPLKQELVSTILRRLHEHLAMAENANHFMEFANRIELAFAEIKSLLIIFSPLNTKAEVAETMKAALTIIPEELKPLVYAGAKKTCMAMVSRIFALVASQTNAQQFLHCDHAYFELSLPKGIKSITKAEENKPVSYYIGHFHPTFISGMLHDNYQKTDMIKDVETILERNNTKSDDFLTVIVDSTTDFVNSEDLQQFLVRFSEEIRRGKMNVVCVRSGQKYDQFGMDIFYGSPFFILNNKGPQWEAINAFASSDALSADPVAMQWFGLTHQYAMEELEAYRKQIFDNTRHILDNVPAALLPGNNPILRVAKSDTDAKPSFIDLRIFGDQATSKKILDLQLSILHRFEEVFITHQAKVAGRSGFGFLHTNVDRLGYIDILRIQPGIDREESEMILQILANLETSLTSNQVDNIE